MVTTEQLPKEQVFVLSEEMKMRAVVFEERAQRTLLSQDTQRVLLKAFKADLLIGGEGQEALRLLRQAEDQVTEWQEYFKQRPII